LEADLLERGDLMKPEARERIESMAKKMGEEEARYGAEKKAIEEEAKKLEHERDVNRNRDPYSDYGEVLLQIAIVMASISILSGTRSIFYFAIVGASLGAFFSLNGYLLIFRIPFFH
jgi:hypothetical protein